MTAQPDNTSDGDLLVEANKLMKIADQSEGMVGVSPAFVIALKNLIAQEAKAFAGCRNCFGKGYATVRKGTTAKGKTWDLRTHINYCSCDRGKQLQQLVAQEANKAKVDEVMYAFNFGVIGKEYMKSRISELTADKEQADG